MAINANNFFVLIALILGSILFFFQPVEIKEQKQDGGEVAELELRNFTLYELDVNGLKDVMIGQKSYRFKDRIEVEEIDYTDSTRELQNNVQADFGVYRGDDLITLEGNVRYYREDGMKFRSDRALIDQKEETITADGPFKMDKFADNIVGNDLFYDTKKGLSRAKDVTGVFTLTQ